MKKIQKKKRQPKSEIAKSKSKQSHVLPVRAGRPSAEDVCGSDDRFVQLFFVIRVLALVQAGPLKRISVRL